MPTTRRPFVTERGNRAMTNGNSGALTCSTSAAPGGGSVSGRGGGGMSAACAGSKGPMSIGHTGTPINSSALKVRRALSPSPDARENSPARISPSRAAGAFARIFGAARAAAQESARRRCRGGNNRQRR